MANGIENQVIWKPLAQILDDTVRSGHALLLVICPFITQEALERLLSLGAVDPYLKFVVRWRGSDLLSGASDVSIYQTLKARQLKLYAHPMIHLKLFIFDTGIGVLSTGNLTLKGLGVLPQSNIEAATLVTLTASDWAEINRILTDSTFIDDELFKRAEDYVNANQLKTPVPPLLDLSPATSRPFSILSLPASRDVEALFTFYESNCRATTDQNTEFWHDLELYSIPPNLSRDEFFQILSTNFKNHPFIKAIVALIQENGSAPFGLVKQWIQQMCSDRPTPYRWELTTNTQVLYEWLVRFFPQISWSVPGRRSQVIEWRAERQ